MCAQEDLLPLLPDRMPLSTQAVFFVAFAGLMCRVMGAPASSPMRAEALSYLRIRSLGLPAASCWIVANGTPLAFQFSPSN